MATVFDPLLNQEAGVVVEVSNLPRWDEIPENENHPDPMFDPLQTAEPTALSPFPFNPLINHKIILWKGHLHLLSTDAIVNSSNETLLEKSESPSHEIFKYAGASFEEEVAKLEGCRSGESKITGGHALPARYVIHTVSPRYNPKYHTAAESALYNCYRSCLQILLENNLSTIGVGVVFPHKRGFPREPGTHLALRTIRRFIENFGMENLETIVITVENDEDFKMFKNLLKVYFPRNKYEEHHAHSLIPSDLGNRLGEPVVKERTIRIATSIVSDPEDPPSSSSSSSSSQESQMRISKQEISHNAGASFLANTTANPDEIRKKQAKKSNSKKENEESDQIYNKYMARAKEDLSDIEKRDAIYSSGVDTLNREIIVVIGSNFPVTSQARSVDHLMIKFFKTFDKAAAGPFVVVYFHANLTKAQRPEMSCLRDLSKVFSRRYAWRCQGFFIVHPSFWVKVTFALLKPWLNQEFTENIRNVEHLRQLFTLINRSRLRIPDSIIEFDRKEFGGTYQQEGVEEL